MANAQLKLLFLFNIIIIVAMVHTLLHSFKRTGWEKVGLFLNHFTEVWLTHKKLYVFNVYNFMNLEITTYL